jgi:hypothetical protein
MEQRVVRTVMRPPRSKNLTLTQAKRAWLKVMRDEREAREQTRLEPGARGDAPGASAAEA